MPIEMRLGPVKHLDIHLPALNRYIAVMLFLFSNESKGKSDICQVSLGLEQYSPDKSSQLGRRKVRYSTIVFYLSSQ